MRPKSVRSLHGGYRIVSDDYSPFAATAHPWLDGPDEAGVVLDTVPLTPEARDAFTPAELEGRIAAHAERVAREAPREPAVACGGCGAVPPKLTHVRAIPGWRLEEIPGYGGSRPMNVIWCPACVAVERAGT